MEADLAALLEQAAPGAKRASERVLMREAAAAIRRMRAEARAAKADHEAALRGVRADAAREAARRAAEGGYRDGFRHGVDVALDPCEPDHTATVRAWREGRAAFTTDR